MDDHMILDKENTVESLEKQNQQQQQSIAHLHYDQSGESDKGAWILPRADWKASPADPSSKTIEWYPRNFADHYHLTAADEIYTVDW